MKNYNKPNPKQVQKQKDIKREKKEKEKNKVIYIDRERKQKEEMKNFSLKEQEQEQEEISMEQEMAQKVVLELEKELDIMTESFNDHLREASQLLNSAYNIVIEMMQKLEAFGVPYNILEEDMELSLVASYSLNVALTSSLLISKDTREKTIKEIGEIDVETMRRINKMTEQALEIIQQEL